MSVEGAVGSPSLPASRRTDSLAPFSSPETSTNSRAVRFVALTRERLQKLKYHRIVIPNDLLTHPSNSDSASRAAQSGNDIGSSSFAFVGMQECSLFTVLAPIADQPFSTIF